MLTPSGPRVIEYNCRFGDPETQVVLPLLQSDLFEIMRAVTEERLAEVPVRFGDGAACCVIMASDGYPASYKKGFEITVPEGLDSEVYVAGAVLNGEGKMMTSGGRVLGVSAVAATLSEAIGKAYADVEKISFENAYYRHDIGKRALEAPGC
jgi:phosphoribosylamine--glycine ligase